MRYLTSRLARTAAILLALPGLIVSVPVRPAAQL
jgi:hypothetical protein